MVPGIVVALLVVLAPEEVAAAVGGGRCTTPAAIDGCDVALEPTVPAAPMVGVLEVGIVAISYHDIRSVSLLCCWLRSRSRDRVRVRSR